MQQQLIDVLFPGYSRQVVTQRSFFSSHTHTLCEPFSTHLPMSLKATKSNEYAEFRLHSPFMSNIPRETQASMLDGKSAFILNEIVWHNDFKEIFFNAPTHTH